MDEKHISPKVLVFGFFFLAFCVFLLFVEPGDYITGQIPGASGQYSFDGDLIFGAGNSFGTGEVISLPVNFTIDDGERWPVGVGIKFEMLVLKDSDVVANGTISLEEFMRYASSPPRIIVDGDGSEWMEDAGTYSSDSVVFDVSYSEPCDSGCKIKASVYDVDGDFLGSVSKDVEFAGSSVSGLPVITFMLFSEVNEVEDAEDLDDLSYQFSKGDTLACFVEYYNGDEISGLIYDSETTLENPFKEFKDASFDKDVCFDDDGSVIAHCNLAVVEYKVTGGEEGEWGCWVEVCNSKGCVHDESDVLDLLGSGTSDDGLEEEETDVPSEEPPELPPPVSGGQPSVDTGSQGYPGSQQTGGTPSGYGDSTGLQKSKTSNFTVVAILLGVVVVALFLGFWIWMLIDAIVHKDYPNRSIWILVVIVFIFIGAVIYFFVVKNKQGKGKGEGEQKEVEKPKEGEMKKQVPVKQEVKTSVSASPLDKYVNDMIAKGYKIEQIKSACVKAGWEQGDVDKVCNVLSLRVFVKEQLGKGFDKEKLKTSLISRGWGQDVVDEVFSKV